MKKTSNKILTISACFLAVGIILLGIGFILGGAPGAVITAKGIRSSWHSVSYSTDKKQVSGFANIDINIRSAANVTIQASKDDNYYVEYSLDGSYGEPDYRIENNTLKLKQNSKSSFGLIDFSFLRSGTEEDYYVRLYVPKGKPLDTLKLYNDYGDVTLTDFTCTSARINLSSGDLYLDAAKLGNLDIESEYGSTTLLLPDALDTYKFNLLTEYGNISLPSEYAGEPMSREDDTGQYYKSQGNGKKSIEIESESGDIQIKKR